MLTTETVAALLREVASRVVLPRWQTLERHEVEHKGPEDLVTIADRQAEAELAAVLSASTRGALIVGEEAAYANPRVVDGLASAEVAWVIDPVDGTRNFAAGRADFGLMLAEVRRGVTVRGWIWQPVHAAMYIAERGAGATLNGTPLPRLRPRVRPWRVRVWPRAARDRTVPGMHIAMTKGSCAIDYPRLATGTIDGLAYRSLNPWDHLPGTLLLNELDGVVRADCHRYGPGVRGDLLVAGASEAIVRAVADVLS